jgi:hypothetical protein
VTLTQAGVVTVVAASACVLLVASVIAIAAPPASSPVAPIASRDLRVDAGWESP